MSRVALAVIAVAVLAVAAPPASASFIGPYDVGNWTPTNTGTPPGGGGSVDTSGAPAFITVIGGDLGCSSGPCLVEFTVTAAGPSNVSFHWDYSSADSDGPFFDRFGFLRNGLFTQISDNNDGSVQAGTSTFHVSAGDVFGFYIDCTDCGFGGASAQISEFTVGAAAVPAPASLTLLITALIGLGLARARQSRP